jgi:hypothetical protein
VVPCSRPGGIAGDGIEERLSQSSAGTAGAAGSRGTRRLSCLSHGTRPQRAPSGPLKKWTQAHGNSRCVPAQWPAEAELERYGADAQPEAEAAAATQPVLCAVFTEVDTLAAFMAWFFPVPLAVLHLKLVAEKKLIRSNCLVANG